MTGRQLARREYRALKAATRELVELCGGLERAARVTRVGHQALSRYQSVEHDDAFMPADVVADLEAEAGRPVVTAALADLSAFDLGARERREPAPLARQLPDIVKETADVVGGIAGALADGRIDEAEAASLRAEIHEAVAVMHRALAALDGASGEGER